MSSEEPDELPPGLEPQPLRIDADARIEQGRLGRQVLVLKDSDGTEVRIPVPGRTSEEPYPYQLVEALGWRIVRAAAEAKRGALARPAWAEDLPGPLTGPLTGP